MLRSLAILGRERNLWLQVVLVSVGYTRQRELALVLSYLLVLSQDLPLIGVRILILALRILPLGGLISCASLGRLEHRDLLDLGAGDARLRR